MFDRFLQVFGFLTRDRADLIELHQILFRLVDLSQLDEQFSLVFQRALMGGIEFQCFVIINKRLIALAALAKPRKPRRL
jgi:hypothetical protein